MQTGGWRKKTFTYAVGTLQSSFIYLGSNFRRIPTTIFGANWVLKKLNWNKHLFSPVLIITRASCQHALLCDLTPSFQQLTSLFWAWCWRRCRKTTGSPHPWLSRLVSVPLFIVKTRENLSVLNMLVRAQLWFSIYDSPLLYKTGTAIISSFRLKQPPLCFCSFFWLIPQFWKSVRSCRLSLCVVIMSSPLIENP